MQLAATRPAIVRGRVRLLPHITRAMVQAEPRTLWVFGDNMKRRGMGGQAKAMRGEPNALGIPTKWKPTREPDAYFCNADWCNPEVRQNVMGGFKIMRKNLDAGMDVVLPTMLIGTGEADLPNKAPIIWRFIEDAFDCFVRNYGENTSP